MKPNNSRNILSCIIAFVISIALPSESQWVQIATPQVSASITAIASSNQAIYAGTRHGVIVSSDRGASWQKVNTGLTDTIIESIVVAGETIFAGTQSNALFVSSDKGAHWKPIDSVYSGKRIRRVNTYNGVIIARDDTGSTLISFDNGATWKDDQLGKKVNALAVFGSLIVAITNSHGVYHTSDSGKTWINVNGSQNFEGLAVSGTVLYGSSTTGISRSTDSGKTWVNVKNAEVRQIVSIGTIIVAGTTRGESVLRSTDNGTTWEEIKIDLNQSSDRSYGYTMLALQDSTLYASSSRGLFRSDDKGATWSIVTTGVYENGAISSLTGHGDTLFAATGFHGVFRSFDGGQNWVAVNNGFANCNVSQVARCNSAIFAATYGGVYRSIDNGNTWVAKNSAFGARNVYLICSNGARVYAGVSDSGLFVSTDNGESWVSKSTSLPSKNVTNISASDSMVVVLTSDSGLFISANNGTSWTKSTPPEIRGALTTDGHRVVAATYIDIVFSADSGKIWNTSSLQVTSSYYSSFVIRNGTTFVGSTGGVHMSKNWGTSWTPVNEGFPPTYNFISSIEAVGSRLFACGGGLWARPISQMTRVEKQIQQGDGKSVKSFRINLQRSNRSEAFVEFKLPLGQHVEVTICTSTGRLVKTLVNGYLEAGSYSYRWDLRTLGAGCYLVNMQTSSGVQTKRVVK